MYYQLHNKSLSISGQFELRKHPADVRHALCCSLSECGPGVHSFCLPLNKKVTPVMISTPAHASSLCVSRLRLFQVRAPQGNYKMTSKGAMKMQPKSNELCFMTKNDGCVHVHPSSVNYTVRYQRKDAILSPIAS